MIVVPQFTGSVRKNDALFQYGACCSLPFVYAYEQKKVEVVHGPSCKVGSEIYVERCKESGVEVFPRRGGGGTVVLSPGMIILIVVGERRPGEDALDIFGRIHEALINILASGGIFGVQKRGISDLALQDKKVLGSSLYLGSKPSLFYYQSSLMVSSELSLIERFLRHPPKEPDYREGRTHSDFCTTVTRCGFNADMPALIAAINANLCAQLV